MGWDSTALPPWPYWWSYAPPRPATPAQRITAAYGILARDLARLPWEWPPTPRRRAIMRVVRF